MNDTARQRDSSQDTSMKSLLRSIRILFYVGIAGQWLFVIYIVALYGSIFLTGNYERVNDNLGHGLIPGDTPGNLMLAIHLALAAIVIAGGPLQFFQVIRQRFPKFHRWNGRIFFTTAVIISAAGLYMVWTRGAHGGLPMLVGNTTNALLIMACSIFAWKAAVLQNFKAHKRWALRAFVLVNGVWFIRLGYGMWIVLTGFSAPGVTEDLDGPFDAFLAIGHTLIPLLILELYYFAKVRTKMSRTAMAVFAGFLSLLLIVGTVGVALIFWIPAF